MSPGASGAAPDARVDTVLQPVIEVATGGLVAVECLARFPWAGDRSVDEVLAAAHRAGTGIALEAACVQATLARRAELPEAVRIAINVSPDALTHPALAALWQEDLDGVIIEVTEHQAHDTGALAEVFWQLRRRRAQIAVDDVGTGYAGLLRLASTRPDYVKIDRTIVSGIRHNPAQRAVLEALVTFSHRIDAIVIGEGVETLDDLVALAEFDVDQAQGWVVGRPEPTLQPIDDEVVATSRRTRAALLQQHGAQGVSASYAHSVHAVTAALTTARDLADLRHAVTRAAKQLGVDAIALSVVGPDGRLGEVVSTSASIDLTDYRVADYPATLTALRTGTTVEVHADDPAADPAEVAVMRAFGHASLLMVPVTVEARTVGILEIAHRTHRRWTTQDIAHGRGLAQHTANTLRRLPVDS